MIQTLNRFNTESLFDATSHFLSRMSIEFDRETAEPIDVADLYDGPMPAYLTDALRLIDKTYFIGIVNDQSLAGAKSQESLEDISETIQHGGKYDGMFIFACDAKCDANITRTVASALTRAFNRIASANPVILIIRQGNLLSLATCERMTYSQEWRQSGGEKLGKVSILRNINCTGPHRGHIDILETLGDKAYDTFEELYKHWMEVFSSELLTKKFYGELSDWYAWAVQIAKFPNNLKTNEDDMTFNHEACIRLITRLIFVWFLKQKHLIPEELFDEQYIRENFIDGFDPHDRRSLLYDAEKSRYYRAILQNLFFAVLNRPIVAEGNVTPNNRRFRKKGNFFGKNPDFDINNVMRYEDEFMEGGAQKFIKLVNRCVPFLNGGLFDCLDDKRRLMYYDGFSERKESLEQLNLPDYLFFGEEVGKAIDLSEWYGDNNKKKVSARGIIDILKRYTFTVEENTPLEQEVSLDPELLGKVFENLLASYNPETNTTARKQTGSFYTPREIVQYMVDESIVAHLKRMCGDADEQIYRNLLSYSADADDLSRDKRKAIMEAIYHCRVLDPACGSGAFPMGILQQMVHVLKKLDPSNEMWNEMMINIAIAKAKKELTRAANNEKEKARIEEERKARLDDIESAFNSQINDPDYARKLYLIENCIYGVDIQPIATQISKLRFFISLVVDQHPTKEAAKNFGIRPLPNLESKFVTANTLIPLDRSKDLFSSSSDVLYYEEQLQELNHKIFTTKKSSEKENLRHDIMAARVAYAQSMQNLGYIGFKGYDQLMAWDMFNQNASSPFFDPEWMFGVKDGFDVVIGNPPYISTKGVQSEDKKAYEAEFGFSDDTYNLFTFKGLQLTKVNGTLNYIIPKTFWTTQTKRNMRDLILNKKINYIFDTADPFESVMVDTCVIQIQNTKADENHKVHFRDGSKDLHNPIIYAPILQEVYRNTQNSVIFKPTEHNLKIYDLYGEKVKALYDRWWDKIKTSRDIEKNRAELEKYRASLKPGDVALLGCLTEGGQGLATANNGKYIAVRKSTKWAANIIESRPKKLAEAYKKAKGFTVEGLTSPDYTKEFLSLLSEKEIADLFDSLKEKYGRDIFGQGYIYKLIDDNELADVDSLTSDEKENGIDISKKYYVPYDKGDKDGNRWYLETPFAIAWSRENVQFLKTDPKARYQGYTFYFREGFCWSDINTTYLKCRIKSKSINDVKSMSLYGLTELVPEYYIVSLINSCFMSLYVDDFVNNTQTFQINDARQLPIVIPSAVDLEYIKVQFDNLISLKKSTAKDFTVDSVKQLNRVEEELNHYILQLYAI